MKLRFLGAARTVTGSFHLVTTDKLSFAVDCGLFQGPKELKERNYGDFPVDPATIDFIILTHAHIDHTGLVPKLVKKGFKGPIYCSAATGELVSILLPDSGHIQEMEIQRKNRKLMRTGQPLLEAVYTAEEAAACLKNLRILAIDEIVPLAPGVEVRMRDAGHILGSNILEIWVEEEGAKTKLVFSGDLGNYNQPIIKDPTIIESADYVIMESTYGDRLHGLAPDRSVELKKVIDEAMARGGNLIIPAFAVERTQDLLYDLIRIYHRGELDPGISIYLDSPLAIAATEIFLRHTELYDDETLQLLRQHDQAFKALGVKYSRTTEDSQRLNQVLGKTIIISASGMCDAGRIKHHLRHNLWRPESTILFVGYQAQGSLGRRIIEGEPIVTIHGEQVAVKAAIRSVDYYSAHADRDGLMKWLHGFVKKPRGIFLVHGEEKAQNHLAGLITEEFKIPLEIPEWLDEYTLNAEVSRAACGVGIPKPRPEAAAEIAYRNIRRRLDEYFVAQSKDGKYDEIVKLLEKVSKDLK